MIKTSPLKLAIPVLLFSYSIEILQYYHIVDRMGLSDNQLAKVVIGYGFEWLDILVYTFGIGTVLLLETQLIKTKTYKNDQTKKAEF